jgi:integrase
MDSKFMTTLKQALTNEKLSQKTIEMYIIKLRILNDNRNFDSLAFLKHRATIKEKLESISNDNTRKSYVASIVAILNRQKGKAWAELNKYYKVLFMKERTIFADKPQHEKSETQAENWMTWDEVKDIFNNLKTKAEEIEKKPRLTSADKKVMSHYMILALYVLQPPRRNADYYFMQIGQGDDSNKNYVCLKSGKYYFNNYKTAKSSGKEVIDIPAEILPTLESYIETMGLSAGDYLLFPDDEARTNSNRMTKALNSIMGKKVGASMLRHIYLSNKYGKVIKDQQDDAEFMAHSVAMQKDYVKE